MNYKLDRMFVEHGEFNIQEIEQTFPSLNHVYNYMREINNNIEFNQFGIYYYDGIAYVARPYFEPTHVIFEDKKGRKWERFLDYSYYDMACVKKVNDKSFNSPDVYHFNTMEEAEIFSSLLAKAD